MPCFFLTANVKLSLSREFKPLCCTNRAFCWWVSPCCLFLVAVERLTVVDGSFTCCAAHAAVCSSPVCSTVVF